MDYSLDSIQNDCYENTTVLINKFNIRDEETLADVEGTLVLANSAEIELQNDFADIDADLLMISTIKSVTGDVFMLKDIFRNNISR